MFAYTSLAAAGREAARYAAGIGNLDSGMTLYNDCAGIREAAKRIGVFAGVTDENIQIFHDAGPGTTVSEYCNPTTSISLNRGDRIIVSINVEFSVAAALVPIPHLTLHTENAHTLLEGAEVEANTPPIPPGTSLVCDMSPYLIHSETSPIGPTNTVTLKNMSGTETSIKKILVIWEGTGGPVLNSIGGLSPGPGQGISTINSTGPFFTQEVNWTFPAGASSFTITFSKQLKSRMVIRLTLIGEDNCAFGN